MNFLTPQIIQAFVHGAAWFSTSKASFEMKPQKTFVLIRFVLLIPSVNILIPVQNHHLPHVVGKDWVTIRVLNKRIETIIKKKSSNIFVVHIFSARALHPLLLLVLEKKFLIKLSYFIINMFIYLTINIMLCRQEPHIELAIDLILIQYLCCFVCIFCFVNEWLTLELATFNNHNILSQNPRSGRLLICLHFKIRQSSLTSNGFQ